MSGSTSVSPLLVLLSLLFLFSISTSHALTAKNDRNIPNCPSFDCGDGVDIVYPFWVPNPKADPMSFCGYGQFQVTCDGESPSLNTASGNYTVTKVDPETRTITLVDADALGSTCPRPRRNVSFSDKALLDFADNSTAHLVFFFNCVLSGDPQFFPEEKHHVRCLDGSNGSSYVFLEEEYPTVNFSALYGACRSEAVVSPVLEGELLSINGSLATNYGEAMRDGFEMKWKFSGFENCRTCEKSGGRCGYKNHKGESWEFQCFCKDGVHYNGHCNYAAGKGMKRNLKIGISIGAVTITLVFIFTIFCLSKNWTKWMSNGFSDDKGVEAFLNSQQTLAVKRCKYSEVQRMTNSFSEKLGQGGYGTVYKGKLLDGTLVAVKLLKDTKGSGEEFINEVSSIGRTNHINVVSLLGFCSERSKRALIYEFMPNGSLDKFLFAENPKLTTLLGWEKLHNIAVGIAKGLEYLHTGCTTRIVHFDIKPHNILLDEALCPKISDFGLAKFCKPKESFISMVRARGTVGYIAPEVFYRNFGPVSSKSDVYSYGMMILEMVGRRRNAPNQVENTSELYSPHWIYGCLDQNYNLKTCVDSLENEIARKMALVGLWCVQTSPTTRPSISKVVEMLEGNVKDLKIPPKPYLCSPEKSTCSTENIYPTTTSLS